MESIRTASAHRTRPSPRGTVVLEDRGGRTGRDFHPSGHPEITWRWWWLEADAPCHRRAGLSLDEAKCAAAFEAMRRRPEMIDAVSNKRLPDGWQIFTGLVWGWWTESWADLHLDQQARLLVETRNPLFVPPVGFTFFPVDSTEDRIRSAWTALSLPPDDDCDAAVDFVRRCRKLQAAGCLLGAAANLTRMQARYAGLAIDATARSVRARDVVAASIVRHVMHPDGAEVQSQARVRLLGHVQHGDGWEAEREFRFEGIMAQLEKHDRRGRPSDFMSRIRL